MRAFLYTQRRTPPAVTGQLAVGLNENVLQHLGGGLQVI